MMKEFFVLQIVDDEDGHNYKTLVFDNEEDYNKAPKIIKNYEEEFYERYAEDGEEMCNWYSGLVERLREENLLGVELKEASTIYVR